jgi:nitroreductase
MVSRRHFVFGAGAAATLAVGGYAYLRGSGYSAQAARVWSARDPAQFEGLVHYASLAANSHNSQPWRFRPTREGVAILPDMRRILPAADADNHHLFASLGCAAENLLLAAGAAGRSSAIAFEGAGEGRIDIALGQAGTRDPLFDAVLERQCTRAEYDGSMVAPSDLAALEDAARLEGASVLLVTDRNRIEQVLELILGANSAQVGDPAFVGELKSWLRFSERSAVASGDGLFSACSGNPVMPDFLGGMLFDAFFTEAAENDRYARQVRSSAGLAVIVSDRDDREHWVRAGRACQRFALKATQMGIAHAHLNQPVEVARYRAQLQSLLGLGERRPDMMLRFGRGPQMPRSLRRPVEAVIET